MAKKLYIPLDIDIEIKAKKGEKMAVKVWDRGRIYIPKGNKHDYDYVGVIEKSWMGRKIYIIIPLQAKEIALDLIK